MKGREIILYNQGDSSEPLTPDQVLTEHDLEIQEENAEKGYDPPFPSNWPPEKGIIHGIGRFFSDVSLAVNNPYVHTALRNLEREQKKRL